MSCNQVLSGIPRDCEGSIGGVKRVLFINHDALGKVTVNEETGVVTAIEAVGKFQEYIPKKDTASFASALEVGEGDNRAFVATLVMNFGKLTASKRVSVLPLLVNELAAIVEDNNGVFWLVGKNIPLQATEGGLNSGTTISDTSAFTVTMTDRSVTLHHTVDPTIVEGLLG